MTLEEFENTLHDPAPMPGLPPLLTALWWERKGEWGRAHEMAQGESGVLAAWVHAYLHRKEGDSGNAKYWYGRAGRSASTLRLDEEWKEIVAALLDVSGA